MTEIASDSGPPPLAAASKAKRSTKGASAPFVVPGSKIMTEAKPKEAAAVAVQGASHQDQPQPISEAAGSEPAIIVFGKNVYGIPQAAWFGAADADLATRAALLMGLRVLKVEDDPHREAAALLRQGQVYASERTFAPVVSQVPFDKVLALAGPAGEASPSEVKLPAAHANEPLSPPATWADIAIGHVVLALEDDNPEEDWFEASVIGLAPDDGLVLRWRYSARDPSFTQPRSHVALMPVQKA